MPSGYVTPDRDGLLSYLDNHVTAQTQVAQDIRSNCKRAFAMGIAEGIRLARVAVEHWPEIVNILDGPPHRPQHLGPYEKHEYNPDFTLAWNPCLVCGFGRNDALHR